MPSASQIALLASVFAIAACGLVYELAAGTLASYLLGDSVLQFSTIIGSYLFAMGIGSWLSRHIERQLAAQFLRIELLVGVIGGLMPALLFVASAVAPSPFRSLLYGLVLLVLALAFVTLHLALRALSGLFSIPLQAKRWRLLYKERAMHEALLECGIAEPVRAALWPSLSGLADWMRNQHV